jgi:hypothetical protein
MSPVIRPPPSKRRGTIIASDDIAAFVLGASMPSAERSTAMHAALDANRREQGMTWSEVAGEISGFTPSMLTNLANGPLIGFPRVMALVQRLGRPASDFVRDRAR